MGLRQVDHTRLSFCPLSDVEELVKGPADDLSITVKLDSPEFTANRIVETIAQADLIIDGDIARCPVYTKLRAAFYGRKNII
jgi:hypothetical protein